MCEAYRLDVAIQNSASQGRTDGQYKVGGLMELDDAYFGGARVMDRANVAKVPTNIRSG